ncbi:TolB family protein, partial [Chloroflexota bacterium]
TRYCFISFFVVIITLLFTACGSNDVSPETLAESKATDTPLPPTVTPTPDIPADFIAYTNQAGTVSFRHSPDWVIMENKKGTIAILSDESLQESLLEKEDFSFVIGEIWLTSDYRSDNPIVVMENWLAGMEENWQVEPVGELEITGNDTIRQVSRDYTGRKDEQSLYFTIKVIVNGDRIGMFIGGRTGAGPEEYGPLAAAVLNSMEVEYVDLASASTPIKPTAMPTPTANEAAVDVFVEGRIIFASDRDGNSEIYTVNTDGSDLTRLTNNSAFDGEPAWSPNSERILFVSNRDGNHEIYSMRADGSDVTRLTDEPANDLSPAWSPDGQLIAFMTERNGNADIYLMNTDGSKVTAFTTSKDNDLSPSWSSATPELTFVSDRAGDTFDLYIMITSTSGRMRRVIEGVGNVFAPNWSSDGSFIAFASEADQNVDLYIISPDGTNLQLVTDSKAKEYLPKWSPDSTYILFVSERNGNADIYIANESGDVLRVTHNRANDTTPEWMSQD